MEAALSLAHCDRSLVKEVIPRFVWYSQARDFRVDACPKVEREREREAGWLAGWLWHHGQQSLLLLLLPSIRITVVFGSRSRPRIWKCGCRELDVGVLTSRVWIFPSSCCCVLLPFVCISSPPPSLQLWFWIWCPRLACADGIRVRLVKLFSRGIFCVWFNSLIEDELARSVVDYVRVCGIGSFLGSSSSSF